MTPTPTGYRGVTELYHFIGKDIVNFHGLFWPNARCRRKQPTTIALG